MEKLEDDAVERHVLETALAALGERRARGKGDDHIVGVLLETVARDLSLVVCPMRLPKQCGGAFHLHLIDGRLAGSDVAKHRVESFGCHVKSFDKKCVMRMRLFVMFWYKDRTVGRGERQAACSRTVGGAGVVGRYDMPRLFRTSDW